MNLTILLNNGRHRVAGSAMLLALMVMGVATMGVAAWVGMVNGRTSYTETMEDAMRRRVALENSRALAEEYMYLVAANGDTASALTAEIDSGETARVEIPGWTGNAFKSVISPGGINRSGMTNGHTYFDRKYVGYVRYFDVLLGKGEHQVSRSFQLRSRAPMLYGDLVTLNQPTIVPGDPDDPDIRFEGNVQVNGRTVFWRPDMVEPSASDNRYRSKEYVLRSENYGEYEINDLGGTKIRPSNFPFAPITAGPAGGGLGFDGKLSTVRNMTSDINSLYDKLGPSPIMASGTTFLVSGRGVNSTGGGTVTIDLNHEDLGNVVIDNHTSRVVLNGQGMSDDTAYDEAGNRTAVLIVILQDPTSTRNLDRIEMTNRNNRRVVVAVKKTIPSWASSSWRRVKLTWMNADQNPKWRMIAIGENVEIRYQAYQNGSVTVYGGVRTDRGFFSHNSANKQFFLHREEDGKYLERLLDRNVWLESYANAPTP